MLKHPSLLKTHFEKCGDREDNTMGRGELQSLKHMSLTPCLDYSVKSKDNF